MSLELTDKAFVIAEAGTCHAAGDPDFRFRRAMKYLHAGARAGVSAIKFQLFHDPSPETMFCWMPGDEERSGRWRQSVLRFDQWKSIKREAESLGMMFLASAFEYETVQWLIDLDVHATKVASRAAKYLDSFEDAPRPLLISNGMYKFSADEPNLVLQCEANYPSTACWEGEHPGFSDHSGDPWRAIDAMSQGCKLIEVHFYIDQIHAGPDYPASLSLEGLELVCQARDAFATFH